MSVAIRAITRIQDADDAPALGAGQDGYALTWDNATKAFKPTAMGGGALLATGAVTGATSQAQAFTNGIIGPSWKPASDSTTALQMQKADGTALLTLNTSNSRVVFGAGVALYETASYPMLRTNGAQGNVFLGAAGNASVTGANNTGIGEFSLAQLTSGLSNFGAGYGALYNVTTGNSNFALGNQALFGNNISGSVGIGNLAGRTIGSTSVAIGYMAGYYETGNSKLFFDNKSRASEADGRIKALVYGEFATDMPDQLLRANGVLQSMMADDATSALTAHIKITHRSSGTPAAGFGSRALWELQSSTTVDQPAAAIDALWNDATNATRKADLVLSAYDTAAREGLRIRGNGSAAAIGFYGVSPTARQTLATGAGASVDDVITALQNLGLVKQSLRSKR